MPLLRLLHTFTSMSKNNRLYDKRFVHAGPDSGEGKVVTCSGASTNWRPPETCAVYNFTCLQLTGNSISLTLNNISLRCWGPPHKGCPGASTCLNMALRPCQLTTHFHHLHFATDDVPANQVYADVSVTRNYIYCHKILCVNFDLHVHKASLNFKLLHS